MSNFDFLEERFPVLANLGDLAEKYLYTDANSCLIKIGMIGETIVNLIFEYDKLKKPKENKAVIKINILKREDLIDGQIEDILHNLRKVRNKAAHDNYDDKETCKVLIGLAYTLTEWFMQTYGDYNYKHKDFVMPSEQSNVVYYTNVQENTIEKLVSEALAKASDTKALKREERLKLIKTATAKLKLTEEQTRYIIDEQLISAGWEADSQNLVYAKGCRPQKNRNLAIAEWPSVTPRSDKGRVDYALFIGLKLVAIIEAKSIGKDIPSVLDYQAKEYASNIVVEDESLLGSWNGYKVPFMFATNGRPYLKQLVTMSGIWYKDLRNSFSAPKPLQGFITPDGLLEMLDFDEKKANEELSQYNQGFLVDKQGLNLREYQINAIKATVNAIINGQRNILLAMATGTGKTRTILGMIYLFLKTKRFKRILFLVDRTSLGEQAFETFREVKLEELMTLDDIYNIKRLEDKNIDKETKIQIATVQSMVKRLLYVSDNENESENGKEKERKFAVSDFDLVIVDEAHRGYVLDKQMSEEELLYRNQTDYISKYRYVIDYFDAVKIGLTATPALHTTEIFGMPVFTYSYREAVNDRFLVDHDAPHNIHTKLRDEGINYKKGDEMLIYDTKTNDLASVACLEDEMHIEIDKFNKEVIAEGFNRAVLDEIIQSIVERDKNKEEHQRGKVLIFAVNDTHADLVVQILKEICPDYNIESDTIIKITASAGEGSRERILEYIRRFKNEKDPSIVVTVDLLSTGIDVPQIDTIVFLRRIKSRILFEQMLGRATRLCPQINKTCFEIYDPVGVYESLESVNTMKPIVANPSISIDTIIEQIKEDSPQYSVDDQLKLKESNLKQLVGKLNRKYQGMTDEAKDHFQVITGKSAVEFIDDLQKVPTQELPEYLTKHASWFNLLQEKKQDKKYIVYQGEDEVTSHTRNYGNTDKPQDYMEEFKQYLQNNINEIMALKLICTKPSDLKRDDLKKLYALLGEQGFTEINLNRAINQMTNQEITADIISIIRQCMIGSARISHEERIKNAMQKLKNKHYFSTKEESFLKSIESYLLNESVISVESFNSDSNFKRKGGFKRINKIFNEQLEDIINELNQYLYDDGGNIA